MFTLTVFEILLFETRSILWPTQQVTGSEKVKISVKNQKNDRLLLELLEKWLSYKLKRFWMIFKFCLVFFKYVNYLYYLRYLSGLIRFFFVLMTKMLVYEFCSSFLWCKYIAEEDASWKLLQKSRMLFFVNTLYKHNFKYL